MRSQQILELGTHVVMSRFWQEWFIHTYSMSHSSRDCLRRTLAHEARKQTTCALQQSVSETCPSDTVSTFDRTSMANIAPDQQVRLWAHVVALYIIVSFVLTVRLLRVVAAPR
jgi:hypothetical protein